MRKCFALFACLCLAVLLCSPASALEYTFSAPDGPEYANPTSVAPLVTISGGEQPNVDLSKDRALLPSRADRLFPMNDSSHSVHTEGVPVQYPVSVFSFITEDLYYVGGHLATLTIPLLGVNVKVYEGADATQLAKGAGHISGTSIWDGNVAIAGHNRGVNSHFGDIHTLVPGDLITLTTKLGIRTYAVTGVFKVEETDSSMLAATLDNCITLYTCVRNESAYRWCVRAVEIKNS